MSLKYIFGYLNKKTNDIDVDNISLTEDEILSNCMYSISKVLMNNENVFIDSKSSSLNFKKPVMIKLTKGIQLESVVLKTGIDIFIIKEVYKKGYIYNSSTRTIIYKFFIRKIYEKVNEVPNIKKDLMYELANNLRFGSGLTKIKIEPRQIDYRSDFQRELFEKVNKNKTNL